MLVDYYYSFPGSFTSSHLKWYHNIQSTHGRKGRLDYFFLWVGMGIAIVYLVMLSFKELKSCYVGGLSHFIFTTVWDRLGLKICSRSSRKICGSTWRCEPRSDLVQVPLFTCFSVIGHPWACSACPFLRLHWNTHVATRFFCFLRQEDSSLSLKVT